MEQYKVLMLVSCLLISIQVKAIESKTVLTNKESTLAYFQLDPNQAVSLKAKTTPNISGASTKQTQKQVYVIAQVDLRNQSHLTGISYRYPFSARVNLKTSLLYQNDLTDKTVKRRQPSTNSNDSIQLEAGTGIKLSSRLRLYSAVVYRMPQQFEQNRLGLKLTSDYYFNRHISAGMHAQIIAENKVYGVHGSFHF
ncbi:hypothetical protein [Catenovulum adriaticum]|uniref:Outer membrane protein with beta-barrel domain n=1 Tax=Catenovulum adriaticum TaxID=2984846 RepID=A0ABY7ARI6_9ALTE|nr:hypothetical protein [Catenovulum sp. TS8]WAJ70954.1 hypothetical protein OLW01_03905 [Catenovulum sp. TS8]